MKMDYEGAGYRNGKWQRRLNSKLDGMAQSGKHLSIAKAIHRAIDDNVVSDEDKPVLCEAIKQLLNGQNMTPRQAGKWSKYANRRL